MTFSTSPVGSNRLGLPHMSPTRSWWKETGVLHAQVLRTSRPLKSPEALGCIYNLFLTERPSSPPRSLPAPLCWVTHCAAPTSCAFLHFSGIYTEQTATISCWMPSGFTVCFGHCKERADGQEYLRLLQERRLWPLATRC